MAAHRLPLSALLLLALALSSCSDDAPAAPPAIDACTLMQAPADALRVDMHAFNLRVWPARIPAGYDGCQRAWTEDGSVFATSTFKGGRIQSFVLKEPKSEELRCIYAAPAPAARPQACPAPEEFPLWK